MFGRILIKDLKRRKGINIILLIFMILAVMFVASSVNNILVVSNATKYCLEKGNVPDKYISIYENNEKNTLSNWLENNSLVKDYSKNKSITISQSNINYFNGKSGEKYSILNTIMLQSQWNKHMLIYDKDKKLLNIKDGELGMQQGEMDRNNLKAGDKITLKFGDLSKEFTITDAIIDPAFGGDFVGMTRYVISDKDFEEIENSGVNINYSYCVDTNKLTSFTKEMNKQGFSIVIAVDKDMFSYSYIMNSIISATLIAIGICLIIISFLILRFTIAFTIQEEYKEIGIMKAIGIKNFTIKKIYLVKYFALISVASIIGLILSIPTSNMMLNIVNKNMIMEDGSSNFAINIICSILVMILVMFLCYISTRKLNKFSAIEAIRNGETGERFKKKSKISLNKNKKLNMPLFMAINDIVSNLKRYIVLILTFTIGLLIIIFPVNTISTLKSEEMAKNFSFDTKSDFLIKSDSVQQEFDDLQTKEVIEKNIEKIEDLLKEKGYNAKINTFSIYSIGFYGDDEDDINQVITMQP
ncbi:MAG: ABC transporter permease, partial [Clostridium sp.]|nr:ABC transporter permease [Clostridium sp.]